MSSQRMRPMSTQTSRKLLTAVESAGSPQLPKIRSPPTSSPTIYITFLASARHPSRHLAYAFKRWSPSSPGDSSGSCTGVTPNCEASHLLIVGTAARMREPHIVLNWILQPHLSRPVWTWRIPQKRSKPTGTYAQRDRPSPL